ncbi:hypothetical protein H1W37_10695 [Stappia taiwanensis]|uniref:Uncharacterized protein n=1 Tax=Stappia taiwanensis TaxID=992267 RepID=A0A838XZ36_9HYPH|nr:hypothetical protein [Stappia taiwanensis]MBA4612123.1 hypothetical protein [Stappia taiwanensis]GGE93462.1 hypothetical protein GCM10007285_21320 [Stappia taiwanensis]
MLRAALERLRWPGRRGREAGRIGDPGALRRALAEQAVYLAARSVTEYTRMRVGRHWPRLFAEDSFQQALETACRDTRPLALLWLARTADLALSGRAAAVVADAGRAALGDLDCPAVAGAAPLMAHVRAELAALGRAPPLPLADIVRPREAALFIDALPLDAMFTEDDGDTIRNSLRLLLAGAYETFARHLDGPALTHVTAKLAPASVSE